MSRYNGRFNYATIQEHKVDPNTGFISGTPVQSWAAGSECMIEKSIPAKQVVGVDGQMHAYSYDVFIPRHFDVELSVGDKIQLISENGVLDEFVIQGVDDINRKYIEIWG